MPVGLIGLVAITALIYFGLLHRALDRLHLTDKEALVFLLSMIVGAYANVPLFPRPSLAINIGGGLVPLILAIYVLRKSKSPREWQNSLIGTLITGVGVYLTGRLLPSEPGTMFMEPTYIYAAIGGAFGYLSGRSRRGAFISSMSGVILADLIHFFRAVHYKLPGRTLIGGAGAYDTVILSGIIALALTEIVGETRERLAASQNGQDKDQDEKEIDVKRPLPSDKEDGPNI